MNRVYFLQHYFEYGENNEYDEIKDLGVYSSVEKAEEAIERYHKLSGFIDYPKDCFYITECNVDHDSDWIEGFTKE